MKNNTGICSVFNSATYSKSVVQSEEGGSQVSQGQVARRPSQGANSKPAQVGGRRGRQHCKNIPCFAFSFLPHQDVEKLLPLKGSYGSSSPFPPQHPAKCEVPRDD